jgi:hypothetical protein
MAIDARAFLRGFVLPLVEGGELHVGRAIGARELASLRREVDLELHEENALLAEARARVARQLVLRAPPLGWDETSLRLAVGIHDLLFLSHPDAGRWNVRRAALARVERFVARLLALEPPRGEDELIARHTLVAGLQRVTRTDVALETWAAVYSFRGQTAPARLTRWRWLRRVREQQRTLTWLEDETLSDAQLAIVAELYRASPLTDLLSPARARPPFSWLAVARCLGWPRLARAVCQGYLERGLEVIGPPLARAFWELVAARGRSPDARAALGLAAGLVCYLYAARSLAPQLAPLKLEEGREVVELLPSVLVAAASCGLWPAEQALGPRFVGERLRAQLEQARRAIGAEVIDQLASQLRSALAA